MSEFGMSNTLTLLLRMGALAVTLLCGFIITNKKHVYLITATVMAAIYLGHVIACVQAGYMDPIADLTNFSTNGDAAFGVNFKIANAS